MLLISSLRRQLNELESKNQDENQEIEFEKSLLNAEFDSISESMADSRQKLADFHSQNSRLSAVFEDKTSEIRNKLDSTRTDMDHIEACIQR